MASYDEDRPNVATGKGSVPTKKSKKPAAKKPASKPAAKPNSGGGYDWGDGRKVHSIPLEQHNANRGGVATYGVTPNTPLDAPLTAGQAYAMSQAAANRTFGPQLQANSQLQRNTPVWYQDYINRTGEQQAAAQAYSKPILDTAQAAVGNAAATAPGLDPSSPQYAKEQEAAKGRQTMAQDSANYLAGVAAATNAYFGGQANTAARELPQVQAGLVYQGGQLASQRQDAATSAYGDIRSNEQNASLARQTLGLNTTKAAADVDISRGVDPVTGKPLPTEAPKGYGPGGPGMNKYGYTADEWAKLSPKAQAKARAGTGPKGKTPEQKAAEKTAAADAKNKTAIKKATGGIKTKVSDLVQAWNGYVGQTTSPNPDKPVDPKTNPERPLTPADIKKILGAESKDNTPGMIHVALLVRAGKPLDKAAIDYLHSKDPNIRIPREWLKGKQKPASTISRPAAQPAPKGAPKDYGQARPT